MEHEEPERVGPAEWESLQEILARLRVREGLSETSTGTTSPPTTSPPALDTWLTLPSTEVLARELAAHQEGAAHGTPRQRAHHERMVRHLTRELELAEQRDALQADRPPGCWCLGVGGKGPRYLRGDTDDVLLRLWDRYCDCPDGDRARARDHVIYERWAQVQRQRRVDRIFGRAGIPDRYAGARFDSPTFPLHPTADRVREWAAQDRDWLWLYGPVGTGKTWLFLAALRHQIEQRAGEVVAPIRPYGPEGRPWDALYLTVDDLLNRIKQTFDGDDGVSTEAVIETLKQVSVLMIDDIGQETGTPWQLNQLWQILNARYNHQRLTAFTSNLSPREFRHRLGDSAASRVLEDCWVLHLDGPNRRDQGHG